MANPFFTIGHSNRPLDAFVSLLRESQVGLLVDVRTIPRSRANPQFNREALSASLAALGIAYDHIDALGGLRGRQQVAREVNAFWDNASFHNYADYAMGDDFRAGLERLRELGAGARAAIMCAEIAWQRCHRRIIADYLIAAGEEVWHILAPGKVEPARLTPAARPGPKGALIYPKEEAQLDLLGPTAEH